MIECRGAGCRRNDHKRVTDRTSRTIGRTANHSQFILAFHLRNKGGRTAAVKVDCVDTTRLEHNLRDFFHTTAAREGFLTPVKYHQYDFTRRRNTDCRSRRAVGIIGFRSVDGNLTIFYQHRTKATDCFFQLPSINFIIFFCRTDKRFAIFGDTKETIAIDSMVFNTVHNQQTARFASGHIITVAVYAGYYVIIRNIMFTFGIAVFFLRRICLVKNTRHLPTFFRVVLIIVRVYVYVVSGNIRRCKIIYHLLVIRRRCVYRLLRYAGRKVATR